MIKQIFDFGIISFIGTIIQLILLYFLVENLGIYYVFSGAIAFVITTFYSFIANKFFTFHSKKGYIISGTKFFIVSFLALISNSILLYIITYGLKINYLLSQIITGLIIFSTTFFIHKCWTFD